MFEFNHYNIAQLAKSIRLNTNRNLYSHWNTRKLDLLENSISTLGYKKNPGTLQCWVFTYLVVVDLSCSPLVSKINMFFPWMSAGVLGLTNSAQFLHYPNFRSPWRRLIATQWADWYRIVSSYMLNYKAMLANVRIFVSGIHNTWDFNCRQQTTL